MINGATTLIETNGSEILSLDRDCMTDGYQSATYKNNKFTITQTGCINNGYLKMSSKFYFSDKGQHSFLEEVICNFTSQSNPDRKIPAKALRIRNIPFRSFNADKVVRQYLKGAIVK